jgi:exopolyphosphatase/guanosine-5'-triphosphate,3'-diphosphate pyrophosphatase
MCASAADASELQSPMCAIDMGSNTFRRIVGTFQDGKYVQRDIDLRTLGVGDDVTEHKRISDKKLAEIADTLTEFKRSCDRDGATPVVAIGTAAFRDAPNGRQAVAIAKKLGIRMEIATEQRESELAYLVGTLGRDRQAVIDNGSRSIELVAKQGAAIRHRVLPLGYRIAFEQFFANATDAGAGVRAFRERLHRDLAAASFMKGQQRLIGIEFGEMAIVLFEPAPVEGRVFKIADLRQKLQDIVMLRPEEFAALKKQKDMDRALPRLVAAVATMEAFGYPELVLTERELGTGIIIEAGLNR